MLVSYFLKNAPRILELSRISQTTSVTGSAHVVPRTLHKGLSDLIAKYLIFVRRTEEFFGKELYGQDAYHTIHTSFFYGPRGQAVADSDRMTILMRKHTAVYLRVPLGILDWRHMTSGIVRKVFGDLVQLDADGYTTFIDSGYGHTTSIGMKNYAIENSKLRTFNEERAAVGRKQSTVWHSSVLGLTVSEDISETKRQLAQQPAGTSQPFDGASLVKTIESSVQTMLSNFSATLVNDIIKQVVPAVTQAVLSHSRIAGLDRPESPFPMEQDKLEPMV